MKLHLRDGLLFAPASLKHRGKEVRLENALVDTGSAGTIVPVDRVLTLGLQVEPDDEIHRVRGVGGSEFVYEKVVDELQVGPLRVQLFPLQVGAMDYGFSIDGIIGVDFLRAAGAIVDLAALELCRSG